MTRLRPEERFAKRKPKKLDKGDVVRMDNSSPLIFVLLYMALAMIPLGLLLAIILGVLDPAANLELMPFLSSPKFTGTVTEVLTSTYSSKCDEEYVTSYTVSWVMCVRPD